MSCRVTITADSGRYRIVTDYVTDPGHDALLVRVRFQPLVPGDLRDYARPVHVAGTASDGLTQLDRDHALTATYAEAAPGQPGPDGPGRPGRRQRAHPRPRVRGHPGEAVATAGTALRGGFGRALVRYAAGWVGYDAGLVPPPGRFPGLDAATARELARVYYLSANVLKASEDKTFP